MKRYCLILAVGMLLCMMGCTPGQTPAQIAATTLPVYEFTQHLCAGTGLSVTRLITESVSCLHDYSLSVSQVKAVEGARVIVLSGGGLEDFMADLLEGRNTVDAARGIELLEGCQSDGPGHDTHHHHEHDPHLWLSPVYAKAMAANICTGLVEQFPEHRSLLESNLQTLLSKLDTLQVYGQAQLSSLSCRELITFHDGFAYFADAFGLTILKAVEEEAGSEASAAELIELIMLAREHTLPAIFTEKNGSTSAAGVLSAETGIPAYTLDMVMSGNSYWDAMYRNIDTVKEALG